MKVENNIGWCDTTINAVTGCDKVSPGCKHCYAEAGTRARVLRAQGKETWGPKGERVPVNFVPVFRKLNKLCVCGKCHEAHAYNQVGKMCMVGMCDGTNRRIRLFADSNSDWLDPKWPVETLAQFLDAIRLAPNVDVLLLTKRIELWSQRIVLARHDADERKWGQSLSNWLKAWINHEPPRNLWLGVSVEDQKRADHRREAFKGVPAAIKFVSYEPALANVDWEGWQFVQWLIIGAESGKSRRDFDLSWGYNAIAWCDAYGVKPYLKQDSALLSGQQGRFNGDVWKRKEFPR